MNGSLTRAFAHLHRALIRRRLAQLDPRVRGEILLLALGVNAFLFWRARVPLDGLRHAHGSGAVAEALGIVLVALAAGGTQLAGTRCARMLAGRLPGPPWPALPVTPGALVAHVAWEARLQALWAAALAPGFLVAAHGLLPVVAIAGLAAAFGLALWAGAHAATRFAHALAVAPQGAGVDRDARLTVRMTTGTAVTRRRVRPARWGRAQAWRVLVERDVLLVARVPAVRLTAAAFVVWGLASGAVWFTPLERPAAQVMAFGLALIAAFAWANVLVALGGEEPAGLLRAQPVTPRAVWTARAIEVLAGALAMAALQAVAARLEPGPRALLAACVFGAALALGLLGAHYGITLGRQVQAARRFLVLAASIAMAASLMITLLGWLVLLAAVIHSALRVPRWWWLEETR